MNSLAEAIYLSLSEFAEFLREGSWRGREREAVSLYAFGFLQHRIDDPRRICIEGAVPGIAGVNTKAQVCKDLVIWPTAAMTTWDADWNVSKVPSAVLEWKLFRKATVKPALSTGDGNWLREFSRQNPGVEGYSITIDLLQRGFLLHCRHFVQGEENAEWLRV